MLGAVLKVFLWDAAGLDGLWRVLSFFGMGLSLLAISWLYARFVFGLNVGRKAEPRAGARYAGTVAEIGTGPGRRSSPRAQRITGASSR